MTRGTVAYTDADATQAIFGLGIDETDVVDTLATALSADDSASSTLATMVGDRLVTFVEGSIQPAARALGAAINAPFDTVVPVSGIEVGDVIVSAVKVQSEVLRRSGESYAAGTLSGVLESALLFADVTADASVTDTDEVTFEDVQFEEGSGLLLTYVDVTRPDVNE